jgi:hypothetical protein
MRTRCFFVAAVAVSILVAVPSGTGAATTRPLLTTGRLDAAGVRRVARLRWAAVHAATGPTIRVSPAYADRDAIAVRWSAFFQSLLHGPELTLLDAYIAPLDEVRALCGNADVLGCYGANRLVIPDQGADGISATSIATHEYGHHVAFNRVNPPWIGVDWGPKRWATYEHICTRAAAGTAYPGAEDANYTLNPGEGWAETYRVLNESAAGLPVTWPIVDPSFRPDAGALAAAREDVLDPWTGPTATVQRLRFSGRARTWTLQVPAPLDGTLQAEVRPGPDDVALVPASGGPPLARGTWSSSGTKAFAYTVCGQRTFVLRVTRHTSVRAFTLRLSVP